MDTAPSLTLGFLAHLGIPDYQVVFSMCQNARGFEFDAAIILGIALFVFREYIHVQFIYSSYIYKYLIYASFPLGISCSIFQLYRHIAPMKKPQLQSALLFRPVKQVGFEITVVGFVN